MKRPLLIVSAVLLLAASFHAQPLSNEKIAQKLEARSAEKAIELSYDANSDVSKIMAVSENFGDDEARRAGIRAMNFAIGSYFPGQSIKTAPDPLMLTLWVMSKKPRFAENHVLTINAGDEMLVLGGGRYSARARDNMEYLNFEISRADLAKVAAMTEVSFRIGDDEFTFTRSQLKLLADLLEVTDPSL